MRYLMCNPSHFDVTYVINPWMDGNIHGVAPQQARLQWKNLYMVLSEHAEVALIEPHSEVPDMPFTANAGLVLEQTVVLSRFRHVERQPEEAYFAAWFSEAGYTVRRLPPTIPFEGAGDALLDRKLSLLWMGHGHRSELAAAPYLADWLGLEIAALKLVDQRFYHLDTCFCPLNNGDLLYYPPAFDPMSQALIRERIPAERLIALDEGDALNFACNAVNVGMVVILNRASPTLAGTLNERGFHVIQTDLSEFLKAGGAAKCLTLRLNEQRIAPRLPADKPSVTTQASDR